MSCERLKEYIECYFSELYSLRLYDMKLYYAMSELNAVALSGRIPECVPNNADLVLMAKTHFTWDNFKKQKNLALSHGDL